jgi:hypothetical protein
MASPTLNRNWLPHLSAQFERARPVLFTGAGFSRGAKNILDQPIPSVQQLKEALWAVSFPGTPFEEGSSLQDLYENAQRRNRNKLTEVMTTFFTTAPDSVPSWYEKIFRMPWQRVYTLNVDDLPLATSRKYNLPREIVQISATNSNEARTHSTNHSKQLEVIHLNGKLSDVPDYVTFSTSQFAQRLAMPDPWYLRFAGDLLTTPVIFIGTRLDEPPLWQHLVLRSGRGGRETQELRHRSYLVTPSLDKGREALLAEFNVDWVPMGAEQFVGEILDQLGPASRAGHGFLATSVAERSPDEARLKEIAELATNPNEPSEFLLGQEPIWADLQSGRAISRESDDALWKVVSEAQQVMATKPLVVVTGTAGSGKSASLMRACLRMVAEGHRIGWVDRASELSPGQVRAAMKSRGAPEILAIDDADMFGADLASWIRTIVLNDSHPLVILAARSGRVDRALNPSVLREVSVTEVAMPHLADSDINGLIDLLEREKKLGILTGKPRNEQQRAFRDQAGRQLLVAMIQATSGRRFEEKAVEELLDLDAEGQRIYSFIAVASSFRFGLSREEILIATADFSNAALNTVTQLTRRHIVTDKAGAIWARHRKIAEILTDALAKQGQLGPAVKGLARLAATKVNPSLRRSDRAWRMLRSFLNHDFLLRVTGREVARNLYGSLEDILAWDFHFWLQRGSLEVEDGDLNLAEHYLNTGRGLDPDDTYLQTEWAYLVFKKACANPGAPEAAQAVNEATETLEELTTRLGDPYPYHILGSQGLSWARRGIPGSVEKEKYLRKLLSKIEEGAKKYQNEEDLAQLHSDIKREYLQIATR